MKLGIFQLDCLWENKEGTKKRIVQLLEELQNSIDCLIFPEMTLTGFSMNTELSNLTEKDHKFFSEIAKQKDITILYGGCHNNYNCIFLASPEQEYKLVYQKQHLFSFGYEDKHYKYGQFESIIEIKNIKFSFAICYDLRFAYHFWDKAKKTDAFIVIANWPEVRSEHWKVLLKARAIENLAYCIGVNRVGKDPNLTYSGNSAVYNPFGETVIECGSQEGIYVCEIDKAIVDNIRSKYKFLEDRKHG